MVDTGLKMDLDTECDFKLLLVEPTVTIKSLVCFRSSILEGDIRIASMCPELGELDK